VKNSLAGPLAAILDPDGPLSGCLLRYQGNTNQSFAPSSTPDFFNSIHPQETLARVLDLP
jgi:hypothetical protein